MVRVIFLILLAIAPVPAFAKEDAVRVTTDAVERGRALFTEYCAACHGLKFYRDEAAGAGISPAMDPQTAEAAFGVAPPDLSLMASARGRGDEGAQYIFRLLTSYYTDNGQIRNRAFAEETRGDGAIAMPPPIPIDDPALQEKARDISAFLLKVSDPSREERLSLGPWVVAYMGLLTVVLYLLNRSTWKAVKKRLKG